jgi:hypothetical protein
MLIAEGSPWAPDDAQWQFYELLGRASGIHHGLTLVDPPAPPRYRWRT